MKIKVDSDDDLSSNKTIEISIVTIVARAVFHEITNIIHNFF